MRTVNPKLVRKWARAVRALDPPENVAARDAVKKALTPDGMVNPDALNPLGNSIFIPGYLDTGFGNPSAVNWLDHLVMRIQLGPGNWSLTLWSWSRGDHSTGGNINWRHEVDGVVGENVLDRAVLASASVGGSSLFLTNTFQEIQGGDEVVVKTQFKATTSGIANIRNEMMLLIGVKQ